MSREAWDEDGFQLWKRPKEATKGVIIKFSILINIIFFDIILL